MVVDAGNRSKIKRGRVRQARRNVQVFKKEASWKIRTKSKVIFIVFILYVCYNP
jgi:hypothetical protein